MSGLGAARKLETAQDQPRKSGARQAFAALGSAIRDRLLVGSPENTQMSVARYLFCDRHWMQRHKNLCGPLISASSRSVKLTTRSETGIGVPHFRQSTPWYIFTNSDGQATRESFENLKRLEESWRILDGNYEWSVTTAAGRQMSEGNEKLWCLPRSTSCWT